jgi:hypothetical protein
MADDGRRHWPPYLLLIVATVMALVPATLLLAAMRAPVTPGCFEYCELGQDLAAVGFVFVGELWLLAVLTIAWSWRSAEPSVAAVCAVAAAVFLTIACLGIFRVADKDLLSDPTVMLAWVFGIGLQLPAVWRLATRSPRSTPLRVLVAIMQLAAITAALAILLIGTDVIWSAGPSVVILVWAVFVACLIPISAAAWRDGVATLIRVGPLLAASLLILLVPVGFAMPGAIAYPIFLGLPLSGLAWIWLVVPWFSTRGAEDELIAAGTGPGPDA